MPLKEELERHGDFLFRWRSYLPILILPLFALALPHSAHIQESLGERFDLFVEIFCFTVSLSGICVRCLTIGYAHSGTSGRNTKRQRATVLNKTGMYSIVRHPLYLGNFLIFCGMLLFMQVWWLLLIGLLSFWLYYERIMLREEEFLRNKFERTYTDWANETPAFLPSFSRWMRPQERFSWKTVLRREYTGFFFVTAVFAFLENARDMIVMGQRKLDMAFIGLFVVGLITYLFLRTIKKRTKLLNAE